MKLARIGEPGSEVPAVLGRDGVHRDVSSVVPDFTPEFFAGDGIERLRSSDLSGLPAVEGRIGAPIAKPSLILCVGLNYVDHANESSMKVPEEPILFTKAPNCLVGPYDDVLTPRGATTVDYEVELAVVIGRQMSIPRLARAGNGPPRWFHYCERRVRANVPARARRRSVDQGQVLRDLQPVRPVSGDHRRGRSRRWTRPVARRERGTAPDGSTHDMIFDIATVIHHVSQFMVLEPGDLVNTGTPPGVAMGMAEPGYLSAGDVMTLGITGLGEQRQEVTSA